MGKPALPVNHFDTLKQSSPSHAAAAQLPGAPAGSVPGSSKSSPSTPSGQRGGLNRCGFVGGSLVFNSPTAKRSSQSAGSEVIDEYRFGSDKGTKRGKKKSTKDNENGFLFGRSGAREFEIRLIIVLICLMVTIVGLIKYLYVVRAASQNGELYSPSSRVTQRELF